MNKGELLKQYEPFIYKTCKPWRLAVPSRQDDILQEARIAFAQSLETHDPEKGAITTHARFKIFEAMRAHVTRAEPLDIFNRALAAPSTVKTEDGEINIIEQIATDPPSHEFDTRDYLRAEIHKAIATLTERQREVLLRHASGETFKDIAASLGISKQAAAQTWMRAQTATQKRLKHLRTYFLQ